MVFYMFINREDRGFAPFPIAALVFNGQTTHNGGPKIAQISSQTSAFEFRLGLMSHYDAQEVP